MKPTRKPELMKAWSQALSKRMTSIDESLLSARDSLFAVSYTHLTLPTIYSV